MTLEFNNASLRLYRGLPTFVANVPDCKKIKQFYTQEHVDRYNALNAIAFKFGYIFSLESLNLIMSVDFSNLLNSVYESLKAISGADHHYTLLFQNFQKGSVVHPCDILKLIAFNYPRFLGGNIILGFDNREVNGDPIFGKLFQTRLDTVSYEGENYKILCLETFEETMQHVTELALRKSSLSADEVVFLDNALKTDIINKNISLDGRTVFGETYPILVTKGVNVQPSGINDFLKLAVYLSDSKGDLSLSKGVNINLKNKERRFVLNLLNKYLQNNIEGKEEKVANDMKLKREYWLRFSERTMALSDRFYPRFSFVGNVLSLLRLKKELFVTVNSQFAKYMKDNDINSAITLLSKNPGILLRNMDYIIRNCNENQLENLFEAFKNAASSMKLSNLFMFKNYLEDRIHTKLEDKRVFLIKSTTNKKWTRQENRKPLDRNVVKAFDNLFESILMKKMKTNRTGSFYIDPLLYKIVLPKNRRGDSTVAFGPIGQISKGSRIKMQDVKNDIDTIRAFTWWIGRDVDLSINFYNQNFKLIHTNDFRSMHSGNYALHSGDVRNTGPEGGAEFIDINIEKAKKAGIRYAVMNVISYAGGSFNSFPCKAGYMALNNVVDSKFHVKDVEMKMDINSDVKEYSPIMFDLETMEVVYLDFQKGYRSATVSDTGLTQQEILKKFSEMANGNNTLGYLLELFAKANGTISLSKENADHVFSTETTFDTIETLIRK